MSEEITAIKGASSDDFVHLYSYIIVDSFGKAARLGPLVIHIKLLNLNEKDNHHLISLTQLVLDAHTY